MNKPLRHRRHGSPLVLVRQDDGWGSPHGGVGVRVTVVALGVDVREQAHGVLRTLRGKCPVHHAVGRTGSGSATQERIYKILGVVGKG